MQEALYHPQFGYYARRVGTVGVKGDFSTSATLHPALGQGHRGLGGGSSRGGFAPGGVAPHRTGRRDRPGLLRRFGGRCRGGRGRGLRYHLVEISEGLRATQRERLRHLGNKVRWHADIGSALAAARRRRAGVFQRVRGRVPVRATAPRAGGRAVAGGSGLLAGRRGESR